MSVPQPPIITCPQWDARPPKARPNVVRAADHALVHHTAGHHPEIALPHNESKAEAIAYAQALQRFHQDVNGWIDSGHNFLICRNGLILQGRWGTVTAIQHGRMVLSAHCPSHNDAVGVEFEHVHGEGVTAAQERAGLDLYAWVFDRLNIRATKLYGHRDFYATACPDDLYHLIPKWRGAIAVRINHFGRHGTHPSGGVRTKLAVAREIRGAGRANMMQ